MSGNLWFFPLLVVSLCIVLVFSVEYMVGCMIFLLKSLSRNCMDKYFDDKVCKWNTDFTWPRLLKREVWPCRKEATGGKRIKASFGETVGILMEYECACIFNCTLHLFRMG